jgi:hypothetical protein
MGCVGSRLLINHNLYSKTEMQNNIQRAMITSGLWLHLGFIGAAVLAGGLVEMFDSDGAWLSALTMITLGGPLAVVSWQRARTVLERAEQTPAAVTDAPATPAPRNPSKQVGPGSIAALSLPPLPPNRRPDGDLRRPASD